MEQNSTSPLPPVYVTPSVHAAIEAANQATSKYNIEKTIKVLEKVSREAADWVREHEYLYGCSVFHGLCASETPSELTNPAHHPPYQSLYKTAPLAHPATSGSETESQVAPPRPPLATTSSDLAVSANVPHFQLEDPNVPSFQLEGDRAITPEPSMVPHFQTEDDPTGW